MCRVFPEYGLMGPAKAALESSVKYVAKELGSHSIRVNCISSAPITTVSARAIPNFNHLKMKYEESCSVKDVSDEELLDSIGETAAFLVSDSARGITGQTIYVDKGYSNT